MDAATRRRLRNRTLVLWALIAGPFVVFSLPPGAPPSPESAIFWFAVMVGMVAIVGLPLTYFLVLANHWLGSRWREHWRPRLFPHPTPETAASEMTFHYTGRRWKVSIGIMSFGLGMLAFLWLLPPTGDAFLDSLLVVLRWVMVPFAVFAVSGGLLGLRALSFEVDDLGTRVRGRFRPFDVSWSEVDRLEVVRRFPSFPLLPALTEEFPPMYALRRKDEKVWGWIVPRAEIGKHEGIAFEDALVAQSRQRGIPVIEIPLKVARGWRKMRVRANAIHAKR